MSAIYKRELKSYFTSPIGYVFLTVYMAFSGILFYALNIYQGTANFVYYFSSISSFPLIIFISILTMKLLTEERKNKTDQLLLTSPVSLTGIVVGKFFAAFTVFALSVSVVIIYIVFMAFYAELDLLAILGNILGLMLLGGLFISIGLFASSLTENQIIAAILSFFIMLALNLIDIVSTAFPVQAVSDVINYISIYNRYNEFALGILNFANIIFFLSIISLFLFLTVRVIEKRRWN